MLHWSTSERFKDDEIFFALGNKEGFVMKQENFAENFGRIFDAANNEKKQKALYDEMKEKYAVSNETYSPSEVMGDIIDDVEDAFGEDEPVKKDSQIKLAIMILAALTVVPAVIWFVRQNKN